MTGPVPGRGPAVEKHCCTVCFPAPSPVSRCPATAQFTLRSAQLWVLLLLSSTAARLYGVTSQTRCLFTTRALRYKQGVQQDHSLFFLRPASPNGFYVRLFSYSRNLIAVIWSLLLRDPTHLGIIFAHFVPQWLKCCATIRKVAGSIPAGVIGFFIDIKSFRSHYGPGVDSTSNRNEYQEYFLALKAAGA